MSYTSICSAQDWFYVHRVDGKPVVYPLAAFGVSSLSGRVIGLVVDNSLGMGTEKMPALISVPPAMDGRYKHRGELTDAELSAAGIFR
ncbi:hypothetical protein [Acidihalobacter prosperus]|uniref:hypothetical protein n=1 Tax=Acidihalobacter prosperus TaxID=160660 RepID=UPI0007EE8ADF|nr:hypothetical protein [Acidihalobacter prosperus]